MSDESEWRRRRKAGYARVGDLMPLLRGHGALWHRTSVDGFCGILEEVAVLPNVNRFPSRYPLCAGHHFGAVCLFDFDSPPLDDVFWAALRWARFLTDEGPATIWLQIIRSKLDASYLVTQDQLPDCKPPTQTRADGREYVPRYIPHVEAWYQAPLPIAAVQHAFVFKYARRSPYGYVEITPDPEGLQRAKALSAEWEPEVDRDLAYILSRPFRR